MLADGLEPPDSVARRAPVSGDPDSAEAVLGQIRAGEITTVIVASSDLHGVLWSKRVPGERFAASSSPAINISEYMFGTDLTGTPQPRPHGYEGSWPDWASGFPDTAAVADLGTLRRLPWLEGTAIVVCDHKYPDGREYEVAPRNILARLLARYNDLGLEPRLAAEFEFLVFEETEQSAAEKGFVGLRPLELRALDDDHLIGRIVRTLNGIRVPVVGWHPEAAPGQHEINLAPACALEAADRGFLFKHCVKELCIRERSLSSFIPKTATGEYGSSFHVHQSLWRDGAPASFDATDPDGMSPIMRQFVAGLRETLVPFAPIWLPTPLSFKRLQPYMAAGMNVSWGSDNKTMALRVVANAANSCRVEHRVPGSDANPYLVFAAMLAGGLYGIENELELPSPAVGDAYATPGLQSLPRNLSDALGAFESSSVAADYFGEEFVRRYAGTRRWEIEQYELEVTDWERRRYFLRP